MEVLYLWGDNTVQMLAIGANVSIAHLLMAKTAGWSSAVQEWHV